MGRPAEEGESPVTEMQSERAVSRVRADTWNPHGTRGAHPPSLNTNR
jgi:hypothetical protein